METLGKRRGRAQLPSIWSLENEFDASTADEQERERKDWYMKQLMHSDGPIEKDLVRGAALGLFNYVQYEELQRSSHYSHKKGWFGHTSDEESNSMSVKRWAIEK